MTSGAWDIHESLGPVTTDRHLDDVIVVESGSNVALLPLDTLIPLLSLCTLRPHNTLRPLLARIPFWPGRAASVASGTQVTFQALLALLSCWAGWPLQSGFTDDANIALGASWSLWAVWACRAEESRRFWSYLPLGALQALLALRTDAIRADRTWLALWPWRAKWP